MCLCETTQLTGLGLKAQAVEASRACLGVDEKAVKQNVQQQLHALTAAAPSAHTQAQLHAAAALIERFHDNIHEYVEPYTFMRAKACCLIVSGAKQLGQTTVSNSAIATTVHLLHGRMTRTTYPNTGNARQEQQSVRLTAIQHCCVYHSVAACGWLPVKNVAVLENAACKAGKAAACSTIQSCQPTAVLLLLLYKHRLHNCYAHSNARTNRRCITVSNKLACLEPPPTLLQHVTVQDEKSTPACADRHPYMHVQAIAARTHNTSWACSSQPHMCATTMLCHAATTQRLCRAATTLPPVQTPRGHHALLKAPAQLCWLN
jgi:hypothetical protein